MSRNIRSCLSSNSDDYKTPSVLYNALIDKGFIDCCPFQCEEDLYGKVYHDERIYMNPPFSRLKEWVDYALKLVFNGNVVWLLMPARTDTQYFSKLFTSKFISEIVFFKGRLRFNDVNSAPFPTILVKLIPHWRYYPSLSNLSLEEFINIYL